MARVQETLAVLVLLLGCLRAAPAALDCQSETIIEQVQQQCLMENGLNISAPSLTKSFINLRENIISTLLLHRADLMCSKQDQVQKALECYLTRSMECIPKEFQAYQQQPDSIGKTLTVLCSNTSNVNFECVQSKASDQFDCTYRKVVEALGDGKHNTTMERLVCDAFRFTAECYQTEMRSCGCSTVKAYETVAVDLMPSPACHRPVVPRTQCDETNPQLFTGNGGQQHLGSTVSVLSTTLLLLNLP